MPDASPSRARWTERYPLARLGVVGHLVSALTTTGVAYLLRHLLDTQLPPRFPFLTFFPAVILMAFLLGTQAGILTAILSGLAAWYAFVPPVNSFALNSAGHVAMFFYAFITGMRLL